MCELGMLQVLITIPRAILLAECHCRRGGAFMQGLIPGRGPRGASVSPVKISTLTLRFPDGSLVSLVRTSQPCSLAGNKFFSLHS